MECYAYYFRLLLNKKDFHPDTEPPHSGAPQNGQEAILSVKGGQNGTSNHIVTARNCGRLSDHGWEAGNDADEASAAVIELVNRSVSMMGSESRGRMPGYFLSQVELLNQPPSLTWQAILKKYVGTITANQRKTRTRLNRRQPERFDLSGSIDDKVLKLVVAIDTSGSVDDRMIAQIFQEIFCILSKRRHDITVIECDAAVQRVYQARTAADIRRKVSGCGGTCFSPVIEYLNQNRYFRDALLIYFTDGWRRPYSAPQNLSKYMGHPRPFLPALRLRALWCCIGALNRTQSRGTAKVCLYYNRLTVSLSKAASPLLRAGLHLARRLK